jgi:hypothetical protein
MLNYLFLYYVSLSLLWLQMRVLVILYYVRYLLLLGILFITIVYTEFAIEDIRSENKISNIRSLQFFNKFSKELLMY